MVVVAACLRGDGFLKSQRDPHGGLSAFVDAGRARTESPQHWADLAGLGLRRQILLKNLSALVEQAKHE